MRAVFIVGVLALLIVTPATAQETSYRTQGLHIGAGLSGVAVTTSDSDEVESGGGLVLRLGYGFTPAVSAFIRAQGASVAIAGFEGESYLLSHGDLGVRYTINPGARIAPYLEGSYSARVFRLDDGTDSFEMRGFGWTGGGGAEIFLGRTVALDLGLSYTIGEFSEGRFNDDAWEDFGEDEVDAGTTRVDIGLGWHP